MMTTSVLDARKNAWSHARRRSVTYRISRPVHVYTYNAHSASTSSALNGAALESSEFKLAFHGADTDTNILADTSDTRDFLKLFPWKAEQHADILATILARMFVSVSASWNASFSRWMDKHRNRPIYTSDI